MQKSNRLRSAKQRLLSFPASSGALDLWSQWSDAQQGNCRHLLKQLLLAIARHERNAGRTESDPLPQHQEQS